jgi:phage tail sheath gpL-like
MPISFSNIPSNWRQPLYWVEVDPSMAGYPYFRQAALLVGVMNTVPLSYGTAPVITYTPPTATPDVPIPVGSQAQADALFGQGSQLACQFRSFFANNASQEVWGLPTTNTTGTAAVITITLTGTTYVAGILHLYIGGHHVPVSVDTGDTPTIAAASAVAAINANMDLPVIATSTAGVITLTLKWKGADGGDLTIDFNYFGAIGGEVLPGGMPKPTYTVTTPGTGVPSFTNAIAALGETPVEFVSLPYSDAQSINDWDSEFGFTDSGRWGWMRQLYGHLFSAKRGASGTSGYSDLIAFGATQNKATLSVLGIEKLALSPVWEWTAAYCAKAARALTNDPARPLQTLQLQSCVPAKGENRFNLQELNTLAGAGIATQRTLTGNTPMIARETTTYQLNLYGHADDAYELVTTLSTLSRLIRNQRYVVTTKFPRHKLADDGTRFGIGQAIVTPNSIKAELISQYRLDEFNGLVENADAYITNLTVERDSNDPNRVNVLYPPDLINGLRVFAVLAQFRLQYNRGLGEIR